ncbi:MAG: hypothetical protein HS117_27440 [Verrucomicrobiaceae bacterium]|nr:hypothetical protein [Verrucomicrobiaceae bacterium]
MKHQLYFPPRRAEQNLWLAHFQQTLPQVAPQLELAPEEVAEALADIDWLLYQCRKVGLHLRLSHAGRDYRLTNVHGRVPRAVVG